MLREQRGGHIFQVSSIGGVHGLSRRWASITRRSGRSKGSRSRCQAEVKDFGIQVSAHRARRDTGRTGPARRRCAAAPMKEYDAVRAASARARRRAFSTAVNSEATAPVVLKLVDMADPPLRLLPGDGPLRVDQG